MNFTETSLKDAYVIEPRIFEDSRGFFYEGFSEKEFMDKTGIKFKVVQLNYSKSSFGVLRGLHFQCDPMAQAKLVCVNHGEIWDVVVDLRNESRTFGEWHGVILSSENKRRLFIPRGFAHGFVALSRHVDLMYAVDNFYSKECESGICYNDPELNIDWKIDKSSILLSSKDAELGFLNKTKQQFT